jgi:hypothetical protein
LARVSLPVAPRMIAARKFANNAARQMITIAAKIRGM